MKVDTESATTKRAQQGILELLLANHPLDCPVCDKGGECPLQDQAFSHGPGESRYVEEKRHFEKPIPISDLVLLDRERCILCDRCTRFADEVAGDPLISFMQRGNQTQVMTFPDEPFASYFSGQHGADLPGRRADRVGRTASRPGRGTSSRWRARARRAASAVAPSCSRRVISSCATSASTPTRSTGAGCATAAASTSRRPTPTTGCWRRTSAARAGSPRRRGASPWTPPPSSSARRSRAVGRAASASSAVPAARTRTPTRGPRSPTPSASPTATPSSATGSRPALLALPRATIDEATAATTVVLLAPDLKEELPVLHLRLRHAAEQRKVKILELTPASTGLTAHAWRSVPIEAGAVGQVDGRARRPRDRRPAARRPGRHRRRAGQPRRVGRRRRGRPARRARRLPWRQGAAGAAPRQRRRRHAGRPDPGRRGPRHAAASSPPPPTATSTSSCCSAPIR